jgi:hypothetical protein
MKKILIVLTTLVIIFSPLIFGAWTTVEVILYLVKNNPFNWLIFWLFVTGCFGALTLVVLSKLHSNEKKTKNNLKKSNFQEKLELIAKQRKQIK